LLTSLKARSQQSQSALLDRKIDEISAGLPAYYNNILRSISEANAATIIDYIASMKIEVNLSDNYRRGLIQILCKFSGSIYCDNRSFKDLSRADVINYLDTYRKSETQDPMHKWIGTYNIFRTHIIRFFKWLYNPDTEPSKRPKPPIVENIAHLKRKEKSIY
jgi:hypothetical protein